MFSIRGLRRRLFRYTLAFFVVPSLDAPPPIIFPTQRSIPFLRDRPRYRSLLLGLLLLPNRISRRGSPSSPATEAEGKREGEVRASPLESVLRSAGMELIYFGSGVGSPAPENLFLVLVFAFGSFLVRLLLDRLVYKVRVFHCLLFLPAHLVGDLSCIVCRMAVGFSIGRRKLASGSGSN